MHTLSRRLGALEAGIDTLTADLQHLTDAELTGIMIDGSRAKLADPDASEQEIAFARRTLALPWGTPDGKLTEAQRAEMDAWWRDLPAHIAAVESRVDAME